jgi:hypothetical protein
VYSTAPVAQIRDLGAALLVGAKVPDPYVPRAAGIPVYGEPGHGGGYQLLDGFRTRLTGLTAAEAGSLGLAALPRAAADLGLEPEARAAWIKMVAALPVPLRQAAAEFDDRFHRPATGTWPGSAGLGCAPTA